MNLAEYQKQEVAVTGFEFIFGRLNLSLFRKSFCAGSVAYKNTCPVASCFDTESFCIALLCLMRVNTAPCLGLSPACLLPSTEESSATLPQPRGKVRGKIRISAINCSRSQYAIGRLP